MHSGSQQCLNVVPGHRPFTAITRVQIPSGMPIQSIAYGIMMIQTVLFADKEELRKEHLCRIFRYRFFPQCPDRRVLTRAIRAFFTAVLDQLDDPGTPSRVCMMAGTLTHAVLVETDLRKYVAAGLRDGCGFDRPGGSSPRFEPAARTRTFRYGSRDRVVVGL